MTAVASFSRPLPLLMTLALSAMLAMPILSQLAGIAS